MIMLSRITKIKLELMAYEAMFATESSQASRDKQQAGTRHGVQDGGLTLSLGQVTVGPPRAWPQGRVPSAPTTPLRFAASVRT
jgi:hypothetical protein